MLYKSQIPAVLVKVLINAPVRPVDDTKEGVFGLLSTLTADSGNKALNLELAAKYCVLLLPK